jgi:hypothetical protein
MRRFCSSVKAVDAMTSKDASIRLEVLLACWPPGPEDREARTITSRSGIAVRPRTGIGSSMAVVVCTGRR